MTRDILVYVLACGCTDWCTCGQCGLSEPHKTGTGWHCDQHGPTNVTQYIEVPELNPPIENGGIAVVNSNDTFTLAEDHPMRAGRCSICSLPIGGEPVTVMAVAGLGGPSCDCGIVPATAYLIHGTHLTMTPDRMMPYIETAMGCQADHPLTD